MKRQRVVLETSVVGKRRKIAFCLLAGAVALLGGRADTLRAQGGSPQNQASAGLPQATIAASRGKLATTPIRSANLVPSPSGQPVQPRVVEAFRKLPLSFEPNQGQTDPQVKFVSRGSGYTLFLTGGDAVLSLRGQKAVGRQLSVASSQLWKATDHGLRTTDVVRMKLVAANPAARVAALDELPGKSNYFLGNDPSQWRTNIPTFARVRYEGIYPGIDLAYYGNQRQLEYDFVVAPGADPSAIRLVVETGSSKPGAFQSPIDNRQSTIRADASGDLVIATNGGEVRFHKPVVYQSTADSEPRTDRLAVDGRYVLLAGNRVGFDIGPYDRTRPLIIDPVLSYSTYLGGSEIDVAKGIAVGSDGTAFIAGETDSLNFPTAHALQPETGGPFDFPDDAFVAKISADGSTLLYSTFLGGSREDRANGIAVDSFGSAYVTGTTISPDFPASLGAADPNCGNDGQCDAGLNKGLVKSDAFATKLNPEGSAIVYSTFISHIGPLFVDHNGNPVLDSNGQFQYLGANDQGFAIAVDLNGVAYVVGTTDGADAAGPFFGGGNDCFLAKISATGSTFLFTTDSEDAVDFGGSLEDQAFGVAVDNSGHAFVTGLTYSTNFPVTAATAFQPALAGDADAFFMEIDTTQPVATSRVYATYLGGTGRDYANGIAIDAAGNAYITGVTNSIVFPTTAGVFQPTCRLDVSSLCEGDVFVAKFNPALIGPASLTYSTYVGGTGADSGSGIALDSSGNAYVTGFTNSADFPTTGVPFQPQYGGGNTDAFVFKLDPTATTLVYSSYFGGSNSEVGNGIAVDVNGNAYVAGQTCSVDFPTRRPLQGAQGGNCDAFIAKVLVGPDIALSTTALNFGALAIGTTSNTQSITITSNGGANLVINSVTFTSGATDFAQTTSPNPCPVGPAGLARDATCQIDVTFTPSTLGARTGTLSIDDNVPGTPQLVNLNGTGTAVAVSPTSLLFGSQLVGTTSTPQTVTLTNVGGTALTIIGIDTTGDFVQQNHCGISLAAGASCAIDVSFAPTQVGIRTGSVVITDSDATSPQVVSLTGHGDGPWATLSTYNFTFPDTPVGITTAPQTVTLTNSGSADLEISSIVMTGDFAKSDHCPTTMPASTSCTIDITFTPTATGNRYGAMTINDNAENSPQKVLLSGNGSPAPFVSLSPTTLTFPSQSVNTTSTTQTVVLSNTGTATLNIPVGGIAVTGVNATEFAQTNNCGATVLAGANCAINVTFSPSAAGTRLAAVAITDDAAGSPQSIALGGTGVLAPAVTLAPTSLTFPDTRVGITSASQTVTLTNSGSATLIINSIVMTGDFAKSDHCGSSLAVGASCTVDITFTPTTTGNRYGSMTVNDNAAGSPQTVALAGNGLPVPATVILSPTSLTFPSEPAGTTSPAQTVTLTNSGVTPLTISSITTTGPFAATSTCGASVAVGVSCTISVTFTPTAPGNVTGSVVITDNAGDSPQTIALANAVTTGPAATLSPTSLTFSAQPPGTTSAAQTVMLNNTGTAQLNITSITTTGPFAPANTCGASVAAGASCTISVTFSPTATGNVTGSVVITDNAANSPQVVPLSGGGAAFSISVSPTTTTITAGQAANYNLSVNPLFGFDSKVTLSCSGAPAQATCFFTPNSATPNGTTASAVTFTVSTTARALQVPGPAPQTNFPRFGSLIQPWLVWTFILALLAMLVAARRQPRLVLAMMVLCMLLWAACGGGTPVGVPRGTPAGTYTLTITAASGAETHAAAVSLTVD